MGEKKFCHLHLHTEYSLLDGSGKVSKIIKRAKELGMDSIAITDHGVMYCCVEFYKQAVEQGIKPILGCEVYVASKSMYIKQVDKENSTNHLVLLVKNEVGYQNLMKIVSQASIDGFYYKPRVDIEALREHSEGIICLSACLAGDVSNALMNRNYEKAKEIALNHANLSKNQVSYINAHLDYDDGIQVYDVSLYVNDVEYSYEINAQNGNIVSYEMDSIYD